MPGAKQDLCGGLGRERHSAVRPRLSRATRARGAASALAEANVTRGADGAEFHRQDLALTTGEDDNPPFGRLWLLRSREIDLSSLSRGSVTASAADSQELGAETAHQAAGCETR